MRTAQAVTGAGGIPVGYAHARRSSTCGGRGRDWILRRLRRAAPMDALLADDAARER